MTHPFSLLAKLTLTFISLLECRTCLQKFTPCKCVWISSELSGACTTKGERFSFAPHRIFFARDCKLNANVDLIVDCIHGQPHKLETISQCELCNLPLFLWTKTKLNCKLAQT